MNSDSRNTQLQKNESHTPRTVQDVMAAWTVRKPTYTLPARLNGYFLGILLILVVTLIFSTVLFICARDEYFHFEPSYSRPAGNEQNTENPGGVANNDGERPYADGVSGNVLLPWAENVKIIP